MRKLFIVLSTCLALFAAGPALAQKAYKSDSLASLSIRLEDRIDRIAGAAQPRPLEQVGDDAAVALKGGDANAALNIVGAAIAAAPQNSVLWLVYANTAAGAAQLPNADKGALTSDALAAAYTSYQRATTPADEAAALAFLGATYAQQEKWRPSLNAYRASLDRVDDPAVRKTYESERAEHGFRITDYKVDSESSSPRVCFQFSDPLAAGRPDFSPFVAVAGVADAAISTEQQQLCVEGLEHGKSYGIVLREGLPSAVGEKLERPARYDVYVRDRSPQVHFTARNYVLPRVGQEGIPVVSVNTAKVAIDVLRIGDRNLLATVGSDDFLSQLSPYRARQLIEKDGVKIWSGTLDVVSELNKDVVTAFPVLQAVSKLAPGVYAMVARAGEKPVSAMTDDSDQGLAATQWFVVSDLGLTAVSGEDGVLVLARSLASAAPLSGVEIRLVAQDNEVLATQTTDAGGAAHFDPGLARGVGGSAPSLVVAKGAQDDYNFLDLTATPFDLTDRGVKGRAPPHALDAYLYAERGVYRSGETVGLTALLRDEKGSAVEGLPLTLVINRPDGVEYKRVAIADQGLGGRALSVPLLSDAQSGTWRVEAFADPNSPAIGQTSFLVEDYVPEQLDLKLVPQQTILQAGESARIAADARFLYGAPGSGLEVTDDVTIEEAADPSLPGLPGFVAGLQDQSFDSVKAEADDQKFVTDASGHVMITAPMPDYVATRPVEAKIDVSAGEPGGRAIERSLTLPIAPKSGQIGVKKDFSDLSEGSIAAFEVAAVGADGKRAARRNLHWSLYRLDDDYQWYNSDGHWDFEQVKSSRRLADGVVNAGADQPAKITAQVSFGRHRLDIRSDDPGDAPTSILFDVGWGGAATAQTPDLLAVNLDKSDYRAGDQMRLRIASRFVGQATIMVSGTRTEVLQKINLKSGDNEVALPVKADWGPGAYVVVLAHRPLDIAAKRMPGRALGVAWFSVDAASRRLSVGIDVPAKIAPRHPLTAPIRIGGLAPGEEAWVTLAAVDVGILNLTDYQAPDASAFFFGQRQLSADFRDIYGLLIDGMQGVRGAIRSGGDEGGAALSNEKPTQAPLARYSGLVKVGPDGTARVTFDIPAFNGSVRLMAVAWSKTRAGSAQMDVIVRDPVVVAATLPRFLAVGDKSQLFLQLDNVEGPVGDYVLDLAVRGPIEAAAGDLRQRLHLAAGARAALTATLSATGVGDGFIDASLTGPGIALVQTLAVHVEAGGSELDRRSVEVIPPGGSITVSRALLNDFVPGTQSVSVAVSPLAGIDVPAILQALDRYPYGCSEQVVSRALPLLYVNKLGATAALSPDAGVDGRIREAIDREMSRQDSNGAFGLWSADADNDDLWLDAYVSDFLTRARENGYAVPARGFDQAISHLQNTVANASDVSVGSGEPIAYAIYVLARNGRPIMGDLRYLVDTKLDAFTTPLARAQLGAALALLGDRERAERVFATAAARLDARVPTLASQTDYGSRLRDSAGLLALGAEAGLDRASLIPVSLTLQRERAATSFTSTQEDAWMVLAAEALSEQTSALTLSIDGTAWKGAYYNIWRDAALDQRDVTIRNESASSVASVITTSGNPKLPEPAASQGYRIERLYFRMDGTPVDPTQITQSDRLVVVLKVVEPTAAFAHLLLVDHLPAGLEIDNPDLFDGGSVDSLSWLKDSIKPTHAEYRDDRFVAAFDRDGKDAATFAVAYVVRAVSPGHFVLPAATIEDMYRPDRFGRTASGALDVRAKP